MKERAFRAAALALALCLPARAHDGPPFPVLENAPIGPYTAALWTDPDIGKGVVFVLLTARTGQVPAEARVSLGVQPVSGRQPEVFYPLRRKAERKWIRFDGEVPFDKWELFRLRVLVESPRGGGNAIVEVEATPDGMPGRASLILYLLPFLGVGALWVMAVFRRRERPPAPAS